MPVNPSSARLQSWTQSILREQEDKVIAAEREALASEPWHVVLDLPADASLADAQAKADKLIAANVRAQKRLAKEAEKLRLAAAQVRLLSEKASR